MCNRERKIHWNWRKSQTWWWYWRRIYFIDFLLSYHLQWHCCFCRVLQYKFEELVTLMADNSNKNGANNILNCRNCSLKDPNSHISISVFLNMLEIPTLFPKFNEAKEICRANPHITKFYLAIKYYCNKGSRGSSQISWANNNLLLSSNIFSSTLRIHVCGHMNFSTHL